jgi:hypothetical protein
MAAGPDGRWEIGIGDPTPLGWITVAAYAAAAVLAWRNAGAARRTAVPHSFWIALTALMLALGIKCAWACSAATAWPSSCRSGPRPRWRTWPRSTSWARWPCRCRCCSAPTRWPTGCRTAAPCWRIVRRVAIANLLAARARVPGTAHVVAVGGAAGQGDLDWAAALAVVPRRSPLAAHRGRRRRRADLHQRHHRPAQGRADSAPRADRQPDRLRLQPELVRRRPATKSSGARPTGPGPAA